MKNLFVPYELAVIAKEKGFNEPCLAWYYIPEDKFGLRGLGSYFETIKYTNKKSKKHFCSAPLYQQLVDWFREKHEIVVYFNTLHSIVQDGSHYFCVFDTKKEGDEAISDLIGGGDYYEAFNAAIEQAFKLI